MRMNRKTVIAGVIVCLTLLVIWLSIEPKVEVRGHLSQQDVAELIRLGHAERRRDLIDWSATPPPWNIRQVPFKWRRFRFNSARVVRIDQMPGSKAKVTIGTGSSTRHYEFVNTNQAWQPIERTFE